MYLSQNCPRKYSPVSPRFRQRFYTFLAVFLLPIVSSLLFAAPQETTSPAIPGAFVALNDDDVSAGWISLFDGQSLMGWKAESDADWHVEGQAIWVTSGQPGLLRTTSQFSDFELELEFFADSETNSGVFIRTSPKPKSPVEGCYEINIIRPALHEFATGSVVGRARGESTGHPDGKNWHRMRIVAEGPRIVVSVDGGQVVEYTDDQPLGRGYIGLQLNSGRVGFRNIRLRPIALKPLIQADPAESWNPENRGAAKFDFSPQEECWRLTGGPGQIETRNSWGDFVLQARCRTDRPRTNSGIFFRCIPGTEMMGYELQIDNQRKSPEDDTPVEAGTGAIFRRTIVPRIVPRDGEWFTLTLAVCGPHVSVWVDGQQVTDWSDTRPANENPRRGRRLETGTIMLQGHDPETAVSFQRLEIAELTRR